MYSICFSVVLVASWVYFLGPWPKYFWNDQSQFSHHVWKARL